MAGSVYVPIVLFLFVTLVSSAPTQYFINATQLENCYTSVAKCSFNDPSLWELNVAPSSFSDAAIITYTNSTPITLVISTSLSLALLQLSGPVTIEIDTTTLQVENINIQDQSSLIVLAGSLLQVNGTVQIQNNAQIAVNDYASYQQTVGWLFVGASSTFSAGNSSFSFLHANVSGTISLHTAATVSGNSLRIYSQQIIGASITVQELYISARLTSTTLTIDGYLSSSGTFTIASSTLISSSGTLSASGLTSGNITAYGNVVVVGQVSVSSLVTNGATISISDTTTANDVRLIGGTTNLNGLTTNTLHVGNSGRLIVSNSFIVSSLNVTNSSNIELQSVSAHINNTNMGMGNILINSSRVVLDNSYSTPNARLTFVGQNNIAAPQLDLYKFFYYDSTSAVNARITAGLLLNASIVFPGSLYIQSFFTTTVPATIVGNLITFQCTSNIQGTLSTSVLNLNSSSLTLSGGSTLNTTSIIIEAGSSITSPSSNTLLGHLQNAGNLQFNGNNPLTLIGRYTQTRTGTITLTRINRGLPPFITIVGPASIAGDLKYDPIAIAAGEEAQLIALQANGGLSGKFNDPTRVMESIRYSSNTATIVFSEKAAGAAVMVSWTVLLLMSLAVIL